MNEAEANKKAHEMILSRQMIRCPMQKETNVCVQKDNQGNVIEICECYKMPEVYNNDLYFRDRDSYQIRHGFCTCYALKGASD